VLPDTFLISVSCHTEGDIREAQDADLILFGPVFETPDKGAPIGLEALKSAVSISRVPLLALGGITMENAGLCVATGAAGIAAIRFFQP
ncbi:MAG: thiamine phosphate synthase, partial [Bryobacteraceae bacterium]|nr:thiamine phosphate synthase [Bryobacteraceae bacterium]